MRIAICAACTLVLVTCGLVPNAFAAEKADYYLVSRPIPMGQCVPILHRRNPARKYASYLWRIKKAGKQFELTKIVSVPTGGGFRSIELWPSASLLEISGWPTGYGWDQKQTNRFLLALIDLGSPGRTVFFWLSGGGLDLVDPPGAAPWFAFPALKPASGKLNPVPPLRVPWRYLNLHGGPSSTTYLMWAVIRHNGEVGVTPRTPLRLRMLKTEHLFRLPWRIPIPILKKAAGSNPKYTWMLVNTRSVLAIGRLNRRRPSNKLCLFILNKAAKRWSIRWIYSGDCFRLWAFGPWLAVRIYSPDYSTAGTSDIAGSATGAYWFFNSKSGRSWQQKLGDQHTWLLYMNNRYALVRRENNLYRFTVGKNKLWRRKLLISDPRIRNVYWACPVPKPQASGKQNHPQFFWEKPGFKLPKALQPPLGVAGSPTTAPAK